ncbi:hypothetical protein HDV00_012714, partial [Rhizophlyctis rosea]
MGVLPAASGQHIPEAFRELMTNPNSPIIDFYPVEFELDMNGKKQDWEAVVKICFIDEGRLVKALRARENQLTKEEKMRNRHGSSWVFTYDKDRTVHYPSPLPGVFPDIPICTCLSLVYTLPTIHPTGYNKHLTPGTRLGKKMLPGFPTLDTLPHSAVLGFHGVRVFQQESPNESMVVTLGGGIDGGEGGVEGVVRKVFSDKGRVFVGWPFLHEGMVDAVYDEYFRFTVSNSHGRVDVVKTPLSPKEQERFHKGAERVEGVYSKRFGTVVGVVEVLASVRMLKGMKLLEDGRLVKDWEGVREEEDVCVQTLVLGGEFEDPRYKELPPPPLTEEFPPNSQVFFLGTQCYGLPGEITSHTLPNNLTLRITKPSHASLSPDHLSTLTSQIAQKATREENYTPSWLVAKQLGMSGLALSKVMSGLHVVSRVKDERWNLGLGLKFEAKGRKVVGWSRKGEDNGGGFGGRGGGQWEFGRRAVEVVREYKAKFPEFFAGLERRSNRPGDFYEDTDFWPDPEVAASKTAEMREFLKVKGVRDLEKVGLDMEALAKEYVEEIERKVDECYKEAGEEGGKGKGVTVKNVPRQVVLKPAHAKHRLTSQKFSLGDRVVHVLDAGVVPLGAVGTVVGMEKGFLDIVFDRPFMGGSSLDGRCGAYRGMTVNKETVLNLTNVQPPIVGREEKVVEERRINAGRESFGLARRDEGGRGAGVYVGDRREVRSAWMENGAPNGGGGFRGGRGGSAGRGGRGGYQGPPPVQQQQQQQGAWRAAAPKQGSNGGVENGGRGKEEKRVYESRNGVMVDVTKRSGVESGVSGSKGAPVQQPRQQQQQKPTRPNTANKPPAQQPQPQTQKPSQQPPSTKASDPTAGITQGVKALQVNKEKDAAAEITQSLKNMLHIGEEGGSQPPAPPQPHHGRGGYRPQQQRPLPPQQQQYHHPQQQYHPQPYVPHGYVPGPYGPPPPHVQQVYGGPPPPQQVPQQLPQQQQQQQTEEATNADISKHIMDILRSAPGGGGEDVGAGGE